MHTESIIRIYYAYLKELKKQSAKIAVLQLTGRLEDRLAKESASCIYSKSRGTLIALSNVGRREDKQKIDLAVLEGDFSKDIKQERATIRALVEAKYLHNAHKLCLWDARDELAPTLKDLKRQLWSFRGTEYGGFPVKLAGRHKDIYGLVLVSYVCPDNKADEEEAFLKRIRSKAKVLRLISKDEDRPELDSVCKGKVVKVLNRRFRVSLKAGLWRAAS